MIRAMGLSGRELREIEIYAQIKAEQRADERGKDKPDPSQEDLERQLRSVAEEHNAALAAKEAKQQRR